MITNHNISTGAKLHAPLYISADTPTQTTPKPRLLPHGGKRARGVAGDGLSQVQALSLVRGGVASLALGTPLNRFVTIQWGKWRVGNLASGKATTRLLTMARDWLRDNGQRATWVWAREFDTHDATKGAHVHLLVHVPATLQKRFNARLPVWAVKAAGGGGYVSGAVRSRSIGRHVSTFETSPDSHRANLREVLAYVLKGLTPAASQIAAEALDAIWAGHAAAMPNVASGGRVLGKRCGVSKSLGARINLDRLTVCYGKTPN